MTLKEAEERGNYMAALYCLCEGLEHTMQKYVKKLTKEEKKQFNAVFNEWLNRKFNEPGWEPFE